MKNPTEKEQLKTAKPMIDHDTRHRPTEFNQKNETKKMQKQNNTTNLLRPTTGLPNHGTRWARAKIPR
jgi:hypothetical protein